MLLVRKKNKPLCIRRKHMYKQAAEAELCTAMQVQGDGSGDSAPTVRYCDQHPMKLESDPFLQGQGKLLASPVTLGDRATQLPLLRTSNTIQKGSRALVRPIKGKLFPPAQKNRFSILPLAQDGNRTFQSAPQTGTLQTIIPS